MFGWLAALFSSGTTSVISAVANIADEYIHTDEEKAEFKIKMEKATQEGLKYIEATVQQELKSKEAVIVAEMAQGDNYTKRARPTVVYAGLAFIFLNYCIIPALQLFLGMTIVPFVLPTAFWTAWGGICATWSIGRSLEKSGIQNKATRAITGSLLGK